MFSFLDKLLFTGFISVFVVFQRPLLNNMNMSLLRRADYLLSSPDSKAEERKCVSNVLKANGYTKTFLRNCRRPVTTSSTPDEREPATGFAVIPYIQGVTEPIKRILNSHNVKVAQNTFRLWGIFLPNLRILSRKNNELTLFILFLAIGQTKRQFGTYLKERQKAVFFCKKRKFSFIGAHMANQPYNWVVNYHH